MSWSSISGIISGRMGLELAEPAFLDQVPIRLDVANTDAHYHVRLLIAPWGYNTYRGS